MIVQTVKTTAIVIAIDTTKRQMTLQGSARENFTLKVASEAVNFDRLSAGDIVTATVAETLVTSFGNEGGTSGDRTAGVAVQASKGGERGSPALEWKPRTARVVSIDAQKRTTTLQFDDGQISTLPIRDDLDLSRLKAGEQIVFRVADMTAIWIEEAH